MKKVTVTAPGKVIFSGEHSVVFGKRAISGAIKARIKVLYKQIYEKLIFYYYFFIFRFKQPQRSIIT